MLRATFLGALLAAFGSAQALTIDFEDFEPHISAGISFSPQHQGSWNSAGAAGWDLGRLEDDYDYQESAYFDFMDNEDWNPFPASWGKVSLDPFHDVSQSWFRMTFDTEITSFSVEAGDFGGDDDYIDLIAYDGYDYFSNEVGTTTTFLDASLSLEDGDFVTASISSSTAFKTVYFRGWSAYGNNTTYFDNINVTPVPEPATMAVLGLGLAAAARKRRK